MHKLLPVDVSNS